MNWRTAIATAVLIAPFATPAECQVMAEADKVAIGTGFGIAQRALCNLPTGLAEDLFDWYLRDPKFGHYEKARLLAIIHRSREDSVRLLRDGRHLDCVDAQRDVQKDIALANQITQESGGQL
jgi:hypothetical protein